MQELYVYLHKLNLYKFDRVITKLRIFIEFHSLENMTDKIEYKSRDVFHPSNIITNILL